MSNKYIAEVTADKKVLRGPVGNDITQCQYWQTIPAEWLTYKDNGRLMEEGKDFTVYYDGYFEGVGQATLIPLTETKTNEKENCEANHLDIDALLKEFNRRGFNTENWDGDEGAEKAIVDGVCNYLDSIAIPLPDKVKIGGEYLVESAQEACMLIIGAYESHGWHGESLEGAAARMFEYAKAGYDISKKEDKPEMLFTLDDLEDSWDACEKYIQNAFKHYSDQKNVPDKKNYFKEKFNIDL